MLRPTPSVAYNLFKKKSFLLKITSTFLQYRAYTPENLLSYSPDSSEYEALQQSLQQLTANPVEVPIAIGDVNHHSGDIHMQRMPHNWRCIVARMSWANKQIVNLAIGTAKEVHPEWCCRPMKERVDIWLKCADILANEDRHLLNASIMLGQGKTARQAEEDTCRTINDMRYFAELLSENECAAGEDCEHLMRPTGGFIAAMTPYNWTSVSANLALCPALMGNCVLWMPSPFSVLSCYLVWKALQKAEIPLGVVNFIPSNPNFFVESVTSSRDLAGINYAGRMLAFKDIANAVSKHMERHNSFASALGPKLGKNFHFVHESADVGTVAAATTLAAFDYSGQRGSSCETLFVPSSLWCDLQDALVSHLCELKLGGVTDSDTNISAVINKVSYQHIENLINNAEQSGCCEIIHGGNRNADHGFFIEPTLIECNDLDTEIMQKQIAGPVLGVYVYENEKLQETVQELAKKHEYTLSGSVFSQDHQVAAHIGEALNYTAANMYLNKPCIGTIDGQTIEQPTITKDVNSDVKCQLHHWIPPDY